MKMYLISDNKDTLVGMRLAGVKGEVVDNEKKAEKLMDTLLKNKDIGIILITEKAAAGIRGKIDELKQRLPYPLIIEIPDRHGSKKGEDYITGYVRESIGIKI